MLEVRLLGQFDLRADGKPIAISSRVGQSLLAFLALTAGTAHRREKLAGQFWPETNDANARSYLRRELWRMRKALTHQSSPPSDYLLADEFTIAFNPKSDYKLDVAQLEQAIPANAATSDLIQQLSFYRGELLPGFYDDWAALERERVQMVFEQKMGQLLERLVAEERWAAVLEWGEKWIALGHAPEPAYRALMLAYGARGDMAKVAAVYQRGVEALRDVLGVEPSAETQALYEGLLKGSQMPQRAATTQPSGRAMYRFNENEPPASGIAPFKGLEYFDVADADWFYGREALTTKLIARVRDSHFLSVIVGASGSGKSSLVRAGLIPALRGDAPLRTDVAGNVSTANVSTYTHIHVITPTAHPLEALATALTRGSESVTATATLMDDLARDPRALHLFVRRGMGDGGRGTGDGKGGGTPPLLLVVDQFEELFTLCRDEFEREAFIDNLLTAISSPFPLQGEGRGEGTPSPVGVVPTGEGRGGGTLTLILTLRADFYAHLAQYSELRDAVAHQQEYVGPMSAEELRRAIEAPAMRGGWEFEPGLVDLILRDVGDEPGALPLLSHALLETWRRRAGHRLTLKGYHEAGGVHGAIAHTAESVYQSLSSEQQTIARNIFLRLTELGEGTEDTRRRVSIDELLTHNTGVEIASRTTLAMTPSQNANEPVRGVLNLLAEARLVTLGQHTAEVAHEALIREWPTLREWLNQDREGLRLHRQLTEAAQEWELLEREAGALYRGARLVQAREWAALHPHNLNAQERTFLVASETEETRERAEREAQQRRELEAARQLAEAQRERAETERHRAEEQSLANKRIRQRAVYLVGALVLAIVMMVTASGFAIQSNQNAERAENERRIAFIRELSVNAVANLEVDPERSILLALQAVKTSTEGGRPVLREAEEALHQAVQTSRVQLTLRGHTNRLSGVAFSPDGTRLATASHDGTAKVWDTTTGKELLTLVGHTNQIQDVAFSPDGKHLATASFDKTAKIWDAATGKELFTLRGHTDEVQRVAYSPDGRRLVTAAGRAGSAPSVDHSAKVWDVATGQLLLTFTGHNGSTRGIAFSPDGTRVASAIDDGTVKVWDVTTGTVLLTLTDHINQETNSIVYAVVFSPDGKRLMTGGGDRTLRVRDAATGQVLLTLSHAPQVWAAAVNRTGTRVYTVSLDGDVKVWNGVTGQLLFTLTGHTGSLRGVALSPDGTRLATASDDGTAKVWDVSPNGGREWLNMAGHTAPIVSAIFSPDGTRIATGGDDKTAKVWDAATGQELLTFVGHDAEVLQIAYSRDGRRLATSSADTTVKVWDAVTGALLLTIPTQAIRAVESNGVAFSPDGQRLATASAGNTAKIWDAHTGKELVTLIGHTGIVNRSAFSPDGQRIATTSADQTAKVWEVATGKELLTLKGHARGGILGVAFSPDGARLATGGLDATSRVWDAITGKELLTLIGQSTGVRYIAISPDGTRLATHSGDGTLKIWDISTALKTGVTSGTNRSVQPLTFYDASGKRSPSFSPDGKRLATGGIDGIARVLALPLEDIVAIAKTRVTRTLTNDECQKYLHVETCPSN